MSYKDYKTSYIKWPTGQGRKFVHWIKEGHVIWAYFNNDVNGYAVHDAQLLKEIISKKL